MACHRKPHIQKVFSSRLNSIVFLRQRPAGLEDSLHLLQYSEYLFGRVMLERMHDTISNDPNVEPYVLWRLKDDSTKTSGLAGLPV